MFLTIVLTECQKNGFYLGKSDRISFFWDSTIRQGTQAFSKGVPETDSPLTLIPFSIEQNDLVHLGQDTDLLPQGVVMVAGNQRHDFFS